MSLKIKNLNVKIEDKEIIKNLSLELKKGETIVVMGPNGSGKSTLANALSGHPSCSVQGTATLGLVNLLDLSPDERSKQGLFLSFQQPIAIPGVKVSSFIRTAMNARRIEPIKISEYIKLLNEKMKLLDIPKEFANRYLNEGFSGGEKKKMEILQMAMLKPKVAILDETDSGLDVDALKKVFQKVNMLKKENPELSLIIITHYQRILNYIEPDKIVVLKNGEIIKEGTKELIHEIDEKGFEGIN